MTGTETSHNNIVASVLRTRRSRVTPERIATLPVNRREPFTPSTALIQRLTEVFPHEFELMNKGGVGLTPKIQFTDPFSRESSTENWENTAYHAIAVGCGAAFLAHEITGGDQVIVKETLRLGLQHDVCRRLEICAIRHQQKQRATAERLEKSAIISRGVDPEIAEFFSGAADFTGADHIDFWYSARSNRVISTLQKITADCVAGKFVQHKEIFCRALVRLVDDMSATGVKGSTAQYPTHFLTPLERISASKDRAWYPSFFTKGWAVQGDELLHLANLRTCPAKATVLGTYFSIQVQWAHEAALLMHACLTERARAQFPEKLLKLRLNSAIKSKELEACIGEVARQ